MQTPRVADETWIIVIGRAGQITPGFASAVESEGWRWEEVPDIATVFARPLPPRAVVAVPLSGPEAATCEIIRALATGLTIPVVVFGPACRPDAVDAALRAGADDFLPLPVTAEEMLARLAAVIRVRFGLRNELCQSDYRLDETAHLVTIAGGPAIHLSVSEYRLLRILLAARNRPVARDRLAAIPLPHPCQEGQNAVDAVISRLRRKLGADRIVTIRGIGYQMVDRCEPPDNLSFLRNTRAEPSRC